MKSSSPASGPPISQPGGNGDASRQPFKVAGNARNPRKITQAKLKALKLALHEFGDLGGIVYNRRTKQLVGGHQRTKVFEKDKGAETIITKRFTDPDKWGTVAWGYVLLSDDNRFSYREVDWDETRETAALIAANAHGGEFDAPAVNLLLDELDEAGFDLDLTGFAREENKSDEEKPDYSDAIAEKYEVVVTCRDEDQQQELFTRLNEEGFSCRLLTL